MGCTNSKDINSNNKNQSIIANNSNNNQNNKNLSKQIEKSNNDNLMSFNFVANNKKQNIDEDHCNYIVANLESIVLSNLSSQTVNSVFSLVADVFRGVNMIDLKITLPIEIAIRCFCNCAVRYTKNMTIGEVVQIFLQPDVVSIQDKIDKLLSEHYLSAINQRDILLEKLPHLIELKDKNDLKFNKESELFINDSKKCADDASRAYNYVDLFSKKVLCIQIECFAIIATGLTGERDPQTIRIELGHTLKKIFKEPKFLDDIKIFLRKGSNNCSEKLQQRLCGLISCLIQCENFAAANELLPIYLDHHYIENPIALDELLKKGLFGSKDLKEIFSIQELIIISGLTNDDSYLPLLPPTLDIENEFLNACENCELTQATQFFNKYSFDLYNIKSNDIFNWGPDNDTTGWTPIHWASMNGWIELIHEMIKIDKNYIYIKSDNDRLPIHCACLNLNKECFEVIKYFISLDKSLGKARDKNGYQSLHIAACSYDLDIVKYLVSLDITMKHSKIKDGRKAINLAMENNQYEIATFLREYMPI